MKSASVKRSLSLVAAAGAVCLSTTLLSACSGANSGLASTPTSIAPNATVLAGNPDVASCPDKVVQWKSPDGRDYYAFFKRVTVHTTAIPSEPGVSYECSFQGKFGMMDQTTKLSPDIFVERLLEPKRWSSDFKCEDTPSECGFVIAKKA